MVPAIIFDMDGVIIDSEPLHHRAERRLLSGYGVTVTTEELHTFAGKDARQLLNEFISQYALPADFDTLYSQHKMNVEAVFRNDDIPVTNAVDLIRNLHRAGIPLALASSSHRQLIELILKRLDLTSYFRVILGGDEIKQGKPYPDIYQETASRLDKHPEQCMAIEDSKNGVQAAKDAGCYCVGYVNPNSGNQDLGRADRRITDFSTVTVEDLLGWMKGRGSEPEE
ncbi:HAD family hydrolase [bacterium]|nr:HAD family hydrolase [bacterium]